MNEDPEIVFYGVIVIAFIVGYLLVSFLMVKLRKKGGSTGLQSGKPDEGNPWAQQRRQQEAYRMEQVRLAREAEKNRVEEEKRRRKAHEEAYKRGL